MHQRTVPHSSILRREPEPSDSFIDLNRLLAILVRRARLIGLSVALAVALAVAYLVLATPVYTSQTQILLDEELSRYAEESEPSPQSSQQIDMRISSAAEILKSGRLAQRVVDDLKLADNATILDPPQSPVAMLKGWVKALTSSAGPQATEEALAKGRREKAAAMLQQSLTVERAGRSAVLAVSFRSTDPQTLALAEQNVALRPSGEARLKLAEAHLLRGDSQAAWKQINAIWYSVIQRGVDEGVFRDDLDPRLMLRAINDLAAAAVGSYQAGGRYSIETIIDTRVALIFGGIERRS